MRCGLQVAVGLPRVAGRRGCGAGWCDEGMQECLTSQPESFSPVSSAMMDQQQLLRRKEAGRAHPTQVSGVISNAGARPVAAFVKRTKPERNCAGTRSSACLVPSLVWRVCFLSFFFMAACRPRIPALGCRFCVFFPVRTRSQLSSAHDATALSSPHHTSHTQASALGRRLGASPAGGGAGGGRSAQRGFLECSSARGGFGFRKQKNRTRSSDIATPT